MTDSTRPHPSSNGISKRDFAVGLAIVLLISLASVALVYSKIEPLARQPADFNAKISSLEQKIAVIEEKLKPTPVKLRFLYDSADKFAEPALAEVAAAQPLLAQQGLVIELQDVAGKLAEVRKLGFYSLPTIYLSESEAVKNPALYQAMQSQPRADAGFRVQALGFVTTSKSMIGLQCTPGNSSARFYQFAPLDCPSCAELQPELKKVLAEFGSKLEYRFRHYPVPDAPLSQNASEAVACAGEQNKSAEFVDSLFETALSPGEWRLDSLNASNSIEKSVQLFREYAKDLGLDEAGFALCLDSPRPGVKVEEDVTEGQVTYELQKKAAHFPIFVVDCKNVFLPSTPAEIRQGVCRARPDLCA